MKVWSSQPIRQCLALITGMGMALAAWANDISIMSCHLSARGGDRPGLYLNLNVEFDLPRSVQDALHRGIPLYFITEFSLEQKRWYWADKDFAHASLTSRLSYTPLTRPYRLSHGGLSQSSRLARGYGARPWKPGRLRCRSPCQIGYRAITTSDAGHHWR